MTLSIPVLPEDADYIAAGIAYAKAGWYVTPVHPETKRPALGDKWQHKTSSDPEQIVDWFAGTDLMLGLHVGRSGAVVLDVDHFEEFPEALRPLLLPAPFQSTRSDDPLRGHYVFSTDRVLGNSRGDLPKAFGEVRGTNGIIVVQPSFHVKPTGQYVWRRTGDVPVLPGEIDVLLPDGQRSEDVASDVEVKKFIADNAGSVMPHLLKPILEQFNRECESSSRHEALVKATVWAMREARAGFFPARTAIDALWADFEAYMGSEPGRFPRSEFRGVVSWAVSQALATDPAERRVEVQTRLAARDAAKKAFVTTTAPDDLLPDDWEPPRKPSAYFDSDGLNADLLATDVLDMGPLLWGRDGGFWSYDGGVWRSDPDAVERRTVQLLNGRFRGAHASNAATVVRHRIGTIEVEPTTDYINFTNGMLNWRTGELLPHAPHYGSTVQLPIAWTDGGDTPMFDKFLSQVLSPDYVEFVWEMLGYMLMSGNPLQVAFMLLGNGRNGKGTLMRVIQGMLGAENISAVSLDSITNNRFASASLFGRTANLAGDIDATFQENTARFKQITGGDIMDAEEKHRKSFRFTSWAVPVFSANKAPGSADVTFGYLRRWRIIKFNHLISDDEVDPDLDTTLAVELSSIAHRALPHLRNLMARRHFESKGDVKQGEEDFAQTIDQVRQWVDEACIPMPDNRENKAACYKAYRLWAEQSGNGRLKASEFYHRMESGGFAIKRIRGYDYFQGFMVKEMRAISTNPPEGLDAPPDELDKDMSND